MIPRPPNSTRTDTLFPYTTLFRSLLRHPHWSAYITGLSGGPISGASIGRHREVLAPSQADKIDELCADIPPAFGYGPPTTRPLSQRFRRSRISGCQRLQTPSDPREKQSTHLAHKPPHTGHQPHPRF